MCICVNNEQRQEWKQEKQSPPTKPIGMSAISERGRNRKLSAGMNVIRVGDKGQSTYFVKSHWQRYNTNKQHGINNLQHGVQPLFGNDGKVTHDSWKVKDRSRQGKACDHGPKETDDQVQSSLECFSKGKDFPKSRQGSINNLCRCCLRRQLVINLVDGSILLFTSRRRWTSCSLLPSKCGMIR